MKTKSNDPKNLRQFLKPATKHDTQRMVRLIEKAFPLTRDGVWGK